MVKLGIMKICLEGLTMYKIGDMIQHEESGLGIVTSVWSNLDKNEWFTIEYFNGDIHSFPNKPFKTIRKVS